jgi:hypothetical protein
VGYIRHESLGMRMLLAQCVARLLTPDIKRNRETASEWLTLFQSEFLHRFVTVVETWVHWYTSETKKERVETVEHPAIMLRRRQMLFYRLEK